MKNIFILVLCISIELFGLVGHSSAFMRGKLTSSFVIFQKGCGSVVNCVVDKKQHINHLYILTASHVVGEKKVLLVKFPVFDFRGEQKDPTFGVGEVVYTNEKYDFAIVKVDSKQYKRPILANSLPARLLDKVYIIGIPGSLLWVTDGCVSCLNIGYGAFGHNAPSYYGNSGGPVINENGEQIGFNDAICGNLFDLPIPHLTKAFSIRVVREVLGEKQFKVFFKTR